MMNYHYTRVIIIIFCILFTLNSKAAYTCKSHKNQKFQKFTIRDGLSNNNVEAIYQDVYGFLWFGTWDGLNRYDGYHVTIYNQNDYGLSDNSIHCIMEDADSVMWVGTVNGFNRYERDIDRFTSYLVADIQSEPPNTVLKILEITNNRLLIVTESTGIYILHKDDGSIVKLSHDPDDLSSLASNNNETALVDRYNNIWIGTKDKGVECYNMEFVKKWHCRDLTPDMEQTTVFVTAIVDLGPDKYWIGTHGDGIFEMNGNGKLLHQYTTRNSMLESNIIWSFNKADNDHIWVSTQDGGISEYCTEDGIFITYTYNEGDPNSLNNNIIRTSYQDKSGSRWIGNFNGGLNYIDQSIKEFHVNNRQMPALFEMKMDYVISTFHDNQDNLWVGTDGKGIHQYNKNTKEAQLYTTRSISTKYGNVDKVLSIKQDRFDNIWLGCFEGGWCLILHQPVHSNHIFLIGLLILRISMFGTSVCTMMTINYGWLQKITGLFYLI
jgi:ligand-binding sensor domain-containing protein